MDDKTLAECALDRYTEFCEPMGILVDRGLIPADLGNKLRSIMDELGMVLARIAVGR